MESEDGGHQEATTPEDLFRSCAQGVAPLAEKRDLHSLRRRTQRHRTPIQWAPTTRDSGRHREPGNIHGQGSSRHRPTHFHSGKAHGRARHRKHQNCLCPENSTIQPGRPWRTKPRTQSQRRRQRRRHHTNPWSTNRRQCIHQGRQTRLVSTHPLLLDMRPQMQAQ